MSFGVLASGMVTPLGYDAKASCAAIRVGINSFQETRFAFDGGWILGGAVEHPDELRGRAKLVWMATRAVDECLEALPAGRGADTALVLCVAEPARLGRMQGLDDAFLRDVQGGLTQAGRLTSAALVQGGPLGPVQALESTQSLIGQGSIRYVVVAGVDSYLHAPTLAAYHERRQLMTQKNADGFLPGESAAAVAIGQSKARGETLRCLGIGWGDEAAMQDSDIPLRAEGLVHAYRQALSNAGVGFEHVDYRMTDLSGDQYGFRESALALLRTMRVRKEELDIWHPADCVGRVGAAIVPLMLGVALAAAQRGYAPGPGLLLHAGDEAGRRAALVLQADVQQAPFAHLFGGAP